ncbi:MAG TPA: hypothetical protein PLU30_00125 [Verrucomicrobiae bacterium]|nr:hypothetical protein [Verrucomicrobiae bacterium]
MKPDEIEDYLGRLEPSPPSAGLRWRLACELETRARLEPASHRNPWRWLAPVAWAGAGAAIAIFAISALGRSHGPTPSPAATDLSRAPTHIREWIASDQPEIAFGQDRLPERRVHLMGVERHEWFDPKTGARMAVESPQERVIAVPASFQ